MKEASGGAVFGVWEGKAADAVGLRIGFEQLLSRGQVEKKEKKVGNEFHLKII